MRHADIWTCTLLVGNIVAHKKFNSFIASALSGYIKFVMARAFVWSATARQHSSEAMEEVCGTAAVRLWRRCVVQRQ
jgi:hypothetical protein